MKREKIRHAVQKLEGMESIHEDLLVELQLLQADINTLEKRKERVLFQLRVTGGSEEVE